MRLQTTFPALRRAIADGVDWESLPADWLTDPPEMYPYQSYLEGPRDGELGDSVLSRVVRGARYHDGAVFDVRWLAGAEGEILDEESCDLTNPEYPVWYQENGPEGTANAWKEYVAEVARTGEDPLSFLTVPLPTDTVSENWQVLGEGVIDVHGAESLIVRGARRLISQTQLRSTRQDEPWIELASLPTYTLLALVGARANATQMRGVTDLDDLHSVAGAGGTDSHPRIQPGSLEYGFGDRWVFTVTIDKEPFVLRVQRAAKHWLATRLPE